MFATVFVFNNRWYNLLKDLGCSGTHNIVPTAQWWKIGLPMLMQLLTFSSAKKNWQFPVQWEMKKKSKTGDSHQPHNPLIVFAIIGRFIILFLTIDYFYKVGT